MFGQVPRRADPGCQEEVRRPDRARRQDDLLRGEDVPGGEAIFRPYPDSHCTVDIRLLKECYSVVARV